MRLLPFYEEARDAKKVPVCATCRKDNSVMMRQGLGCGFEVRDPRIVPQPFAPAFWVERDRRPTVCPGFSTTLPEVREIVDLYPFFESGGALLPAALDGQQPTSVLLRGLAELRGGINEHARSKLPKPKGGE